MLHRTLASILIVALVMTAVPCRAQVEPQLPSWNWDNPSGDATPWAPSTLTVVELAGLVLAVDLFFGGRVSGALYRAAVLGGERLFGRARVVAPGAAAAIR